MSAPLPTLLILGRRGHGVVDYASDIAAALARRPGGVRVERVPGAAEARDIAATADRVHLHITDRLFGASPEEAADAVEGIAAATRLSITLHDVPQPSDGTMFARRAAAYSRFIAAARGVIVGSRHELALLRAHSGFAGDAEVIPLGARRASPLPASSRPAGPNLTVLLAGFVYPGKGHAAAIRAAAAAAAALRSDGETVRSVVVRAIGGASAGHESDLDRLRADADAAGVRFEATGFLEGAADYARRLDDEGIPLVAHEHISASRSMLDWVEAGRRPLVVRSTYAEELGALRPGTMTVYEPDDLARVLADTWRDGAATRLDPAVTLAPTLDDAAEAYRAWWSR